MTDHPGFGAGQVRAVVGQLGIEVAESGDELIAGCPMHLTRTGKLDQHPSWSINAVTGAHFCFSCRYGGNLVSLVRDLRGLAAADRLRTDLVRHGRLVPEHRRDFGGSVAATLRSAQTVSRPSARPPGLSHPAILTMFDDPPEPVLAARRMDLDTALAYGVRWDTDAVSWILPIRSVTGPDLLGWQVKTDRARYFHNAPRGLRKADGVFCPIRPPDGLLAVVESPLDAVLLAGHGLPAAAVLGSVLSGPQLHWLARFDKVLFILDNDHAGRLESARLRPLLPGLGVRAVFFDHQGTDGKDPGEWTTPSLKAVVRRYDGLMSRYS